MELLLAQRNEATTIEDILENAQLNRKNIAMDVIYWVSIMQFWSMEC